MAYKISLLLCLPLVILAISSGFSQNKKNGTAPKSDYYSNYTPSAPTQNGLGKFGGLPVNYYTGLPEVSLNLMTLTSRDLSLPISLNYDATGVKLEEFSGPVGLKWNLEAGGAITRSVNGLPDEDPNLGYFKFRNELNASTIDFASWTDFSEKDSRDCEPDEFSLNINGRSIKFVIDNGVGRTIPKQNVLITFTQDASTKKINQFTVTTEDGTKYIFGGSSNSIEERKVDVLNMSYYYFYYGSIPDKFTNHDGTISSTNTFFYLGPEELGLPDGISEKLGTSYNSKWHLVKITSPSSDAITFNYTKLSDQQYVNHPNYVRRTASMTGLTSYSYTENHCTAHNILGQCSVNHDFTWTHGSGIDGITIMAYRLFAKNSNPSETSLNSITKWPPLPVPIMDGQFHDPVKFPVSPDGMILTQQFITESVIKLTGITTLAGNSVTLESSPRGDLANAIKYDRIYMTSQNAKVVNDIRLNFKMIESDDYGGEWLSETWPSSPMPAPPTVWYKYYNQMGDDWNNKGYNYFRVFLEDISQNVNGIITPLYRFGYNKRELLARRTSSEQTVIGTQAISGTGDSYVLPTYNRFPEKGIFGLGNLNKITYRSGGSTEFNFSSTTGQLLTMVDKDEMGSIIQQKELNVIESFVNSGALMASTQYNLMNGATDYSAMHVISSYPQNHSFSLTHGVYFANKRIRVYNGTKDNNAGYEEFTFTTDPDQKTAVSASPQDVDQNGNAIASTNDDVFPFPKNLDRDHVRGMLDEYKVFDKLGQPVSSEKNYYSINDSDWPDPSVREPAFTLMGFEGGTLVSTASGPKKIRYARYTISADKVFKYKTISKVYDQSTPRDLNKTISTVKLYGWDSNSGIITYTSTYNELDPTNKVETLVHTPTDLAYGQPAAGVTPNADAQAILDMNARHQHNSPIEIETNYLVNNVAVKGPRVVYKYKSTSNFIKPYQVLKVDKPATDYHFSYTAKLDGIFKPDSRMRIVQNYDSYDATTGNILQQTGIDGIVSKYQWGYNNSLVTNYTINPGSSQQVYSYSHTPMIGVSSITDQNGVATYYNYDLSNRLMNIKDNEGKMMSRYIYHYRNETQVRLTATLTASGDYVAGGMMTFQTNAEVRDGGDVCYTWDFGDGTTTVTTTNSVNHYYNSSGVFTVKLTKSHPALEEATATTSITIAPPLSVGSACVAGPQKVSFCNGTSTVIQPGSCGGGTTTILKVTATGGYGALSYSWQLLNSGVWETFNSGATSAPPTNFTSRVLGNYNVRCLVSDAKGNQQISGEVQLSVFCQQ